LSGLPLPRQLQRRFLPVLAGAVVTTVVAGVVLVVLWVQPAKSAAARRSAKIMLMSASLLGVNLPFITFTIR